MDGLSTVFPDHERNRVDRGKRGRISDFIRPQHKRTAKMLGYTMFLGDAASYGGLSVIARRHLTLAERGGLACAFLGSMPEDCAMQAAATVLGATGDPLPPFLGGMEDARHWANRASDAERKAYALACYEAMTPRDQAAFYRHISTVEVAA
jgi:hypothetical protein